MLDLYKFHNDPKTLDQRVIVHQRLDLVYDFIKDMFTILYANEKFKLDWKHDIVGNTEEYIELTMELNGEFKHGMVRIFYENNEAEVKTSINGSMITRTHGYDVDNQLNNDGIYTAIHRFIKQLQKS